MNIEINVDVNEKAKGFYDISIGDVFSGTFNLSWNNSIDSIKEKLTGIFLKTTEGILLLDDSGDYMEMTHFVVDLSYQAEVYNYKLLKARLIIDE